MQEPPLERLERYLQITAEIRALEIERAALSAKILEYLQGNEIKSMALLGYQFTHCIRKKFNYSPAILAFEEEVKKQKKQWELNNPTDYEPISYISSKSL